MANFAELRDVVLDANLALPANGLVTLDLGQRKCDRPRAGRRGDQTQRSPLRRARLRGHRDRRPRWRDRRRASEPVDRHTHTPGAVSGVRGDRRCRAHALEVGRQHGPRHNARSPLYGTTHADLCAVPIPVTRALTPQEVDDGYELHTGTVLIETISKLDPAQLPCALVRGHAPFAWGADGCQSR